jgi:hypothetical protein
MRTSSGETELTSPADPAAVLADASAWQLGGMPEREPDDADDMWPLEIWLSREEPEPDADTWHAGTVHAMRGLRSFFAGRRREPPRNPSGR